MRRRTLLSATGTLGAALAAGCTGRPGGTTTGTDTGDGEFEFDPGADEPFEQVEVGDRENVLLPGENRPHAVAVWNTVAAERSLGLRVTDDGATALDRTVTFPADGYLTLALLEPGSYEVSLSAGDETVGVLSVGTGWFDCNDSRTNVGVFEDRLEHVSVATTAACRGPTVADHDFAVTDTGCGERNEGSLSVEGQTVTLAGRLRTPDPCHGADLSVADAGGEAVADATDSVTLLVSPVDGAAEVCQQCVGEVAYEGSVSFEDGAPEEVVLVHATGDQRVEVARH